MTEQKSRDQVLARIRQDIAEQREAALRETDPAKRDRMLRHARSHEDYAEEEADAIVAEIAENQQSALSLRVPAKLAAELKARAELENVPVAALVRKLLVEALRGERPASVLTVAQVEEIARRVYRESA